MLSEELLIEALHDAVKGATPACSRFCTYGAELEDGKYRVWHNGTGSRDTDAQVVYADKTLSLAKDGLASKLRGWVNSLHRGERIDLNAALAAEAETWVDPGVWAALSVDRGPAMLGWPWPQTVTVGPSATVGITPYTTVTAGAGVVMWPRPGSIGTP